MSINSLPLFLFGLLLTPVGIAASPDPVAAEKLAQSSNCFKCHLIDQKKESTPWREIAGKYRGKPNAVEQLTQHVTLGRKVKFDDGHEENHKKVKSKDPDQIRNLVDWILSL
jgi:cytochrome c